MKWILISCLDQFTSLFCVHEWFKTDRFLVTIFCRNLIFNWTTSKLNNWILKTMNQQKSIRMMKANFYPRLVFHGSEPIQCPWLSGLGVWFALRVREVPGSNPGWAQLFFSFFSFFSVSGHDGVHECNNRIPQEKIHKELLSLISRETDSSEGKTNSFVKVTIGGARTSVRAKASC